MNNKQLMDDGFSKKEIVDMWNAWYIVRTTYVSFQNELLNALEFGVIRIRTAKKTQTLKFSKKARYKIAKRIIDGKITQVWVYRQGKEV